MFALNRTKTATSQKLPCILFLLLFIYFICFFYTSSNQDTLLPFHTWAAKMGKNDQIFNSLQ